MSVSLWSVQPCLEFVLNVLNDCRSQQRDGILDLSVFNLFTVMYLLDKSKARDKGYEVRSQN